MDAGSKQQQSRWTESRDWPDVCWSLGSELTKKKNDDDDDDD
jgi:hypothetical protein